MPNNRLHYSITQVGIKGDGQASYDAMHGVQSIGMTTNFPLRNIQELGQSQIYELIEEIPTIDTTITKCLDGYPLVYHEATVDATSPTLNGRSVAKCLIAIGYFTETLDSATGTAASEVETSGNFSTSIRYNFPVDGSPFREEVSFQSHDKVWANDPRMLQAAPWAGSNTLSFAGAFGSNNDSPIGSGQVNFRPNLNFYYDGSKALDTNGMVGDPDATILPPEVWGISTSGTNEEISGGVFSAHVQDISVSTDLRREDLFEQGHRNPYAKVLTPPIEVTCEVTTTSSSGDMISGTRGGVLGNASGRCVLNPNLANRTIRIATCEGTRIYLGTKCKLVSSSNNGGDAGGGNVTNSYTFRTYGTFTVMHSGDPNANGATWWAARATYLVG